MIGQACVAHAYEKDFVTQLFDGLAVELIFLKEGELPIYRCEEDGELRVAEMHLIQVMLPELDVAEMPEKLRAELLKLRKPDSNKAFITTADYAEINNKLFTFAQLNVGFVYDQPERNDDLAIQKQI